MASEAMVYVVDDDPAMRASLDFLLGAAGFTVKVFDSAANFLAGVGADTVGCVVTDVRMPGMDGIALLKRLKENNAKHGVVVMTGHGDIPLAVEAMKLGAVDFIEKPFDDDRLIDAIRAAFAGAAGASQDDAVSAQLAARLKSLSPRERQVMEGLAAGLSNKAIARDCDISPRTVEVYRANLMTKMHAANLSELVRMAMRTGLLKD